MVYWCNKKLKHHETLKTPSAMKVASVPCLPFCVFVFSPYPASIGPRKRERGKIRWPSMSSHRIFPHRFWTPRTNPKAEIPIPYNLNRIPELLVPEILDAVSRFVSTPCHGTTLHLATEGGGYWDGLFHNSRAQDPDSGWSRQRTAQQGEGVWWVGVLTISKYLVKYIAFQNIQCTL